MKVPTNNEGPRNMAHHTAATSADDTNSNNNNIVGLANNPPPINIYKHLRKAAGSKQPDTLPNFLRDHPSLSLSDLNDTTYDGRSALHMACWYGSISNVSLLLDMGCDINNIAAKSYNYGKSPIFFAATRSRKDVMNLMLDRGANVLIVNNKGQSLYSIVCSHFDSEVIERIKQIEIEQEDDNKPLNGWVNYRQTHGDGMIYGDLDVRFIGRALTNDDVVKDGVVNPTTKESRKGNFARNNPNAYNSRKKNGASKSMKKDAPKTELTEEEQMQLEKHWNEVTRALQSNDSWGVFSSLLGLVQFMEGTKIQSSWVVEGSSRLEFMVKLEQTLCEITFDDTKNYIEETSTNNLNTVLAEASIFCGSGDRHVTLVKRILTKAEEGQTDQRVSNGDISLTDQETKQLQQFWSDTKDALKCNNLHNAFISLLKIVVFWDTKNCSWLTKSTAKLHDILDEKDIALDGDMMKEIMGYCESNDDHRHSNLLKKMITKSCSSGESVQSNGNRAATLHRQQRKKDHILPDHYNSLIKSLQESTITSLSWSMLMNSQSQDDGETIFLSLPNAPKWIDNIQELKCLQSKLHSVLDNANGGHITSFDNFIAFDSEFRSDEGTTKLATIQFSILEDGLPSAWVVDLCPNPPDASYSMMTCDMLRWLFLESNVDLLGFAPRHDIHMMSSYIGKEIPLSSPKLWDVQLLASHKMAKDAGRGSNMMSSSLPGLKACCSYFLRGSGVVNYELSKTEQCSNWAQRPLATSQLGYAGLDATVLLVLLAELVRS